MSGPRIVSGETLPPTPADVALSRALDAARAALTRGSASKGARCSRRADLARTLAAGRAAAEHLARAFNEAAHVDLLAAVAVEAARDVLPFDEAEMDF